MTFEDSFSLLAEIIPLVFLGLYFASLAYRIPSLQKLSIVMRPLCSLSRFPFCCSIYFTACHINLPAAVMTLVRFRKDGMVSDNSVVVASLVARAPVMIYIALFFSCPIALPVLGMAVGSLYIGCFVACGALQTLIGIIIGRSLLKRHCLVEVAHDGNQERLPLRQTLSPFLRH